MKKINVEDIRYAYLSNNNDNIVNIDGDIFELRGNELYRCTDWGLDFRCKLNEKIVDVIMDMIYQDMPF